MNTHKENQINFHKIVINSYHSAKYLAFTAVVIGVLSGCSPEAASFKPQNIAYPSDEQISVALQTQLQSDPNSAAARELIQSLGGEKGKLQFAIDQVIYRESAFEVHYHAVLKMGQSGEQSLKTLYARMIPEEEKAKIPEATFAAYSQWLQNHAAAMKKEPSQQAQGQALSESLASLDKCYKDTQPGAEVVVMNGLGALLLPERKGLYAEKLAMASTTVRCLPL